MRPNKVHEPSCPPFRTLPSASYTCELLSIGWSSARVLPPYWLLSADSMLWSAAKAVEAARSKNKKAWIDKVLFIVDPDASEPRSCRDRMEFFFGRSQYRL